MPEVPGAPYEPYFTAQPTERPIQLRGIEAPPSAFGAPVANAIQTFGGVVNKDIAEEVGNRALALRQLQVEGQMRDLTTQYYQTIAPKEEDFLKKQGMDASQDALNAHVADIGQTQSSFMARARSIGGMYGANQFGNEAASMTRNFIQNATRHSSQQFVVAQDQSIDNQIAAKKDEMGRTRDPKRLQQLSDDMAALETQRGGLHGSTQDTVDYRTRVAKSGGITENVSTTLRETPEIGIQRAQQEWDNPDLTATDRDRLYRETQQAGIAASRRWVADTFAGNSAALGERPLSVPLIREALKGTEGWPKEGPVITDPRSQYYGQKATPGGVMPGNLSGWLKEAGMPAMTVDEYRKDANAQNQLMDFKINQWLSDPKYNVHNANDVASMWFTGHPLTPGTLSASDHFHNGAWYIPTFNQHLASLMTSKEFTEAARAHGDSIKTDMVPDLGQTYAEAAAGGRERQMTLARGEKIDYRQDLETRIESKTWKSGQEFENDPQYPDYQRRANELGLGDYFLRIPEAIDRWNSRELKYIGEQEHDRLIDEYVNEPDKFMDENLYLNKNLKRSDIGLFNAMKKQLNGQGFVERDFDTALKSLKASYPNEVPDRTQDKEGYTRYVGALHRVMQTFEEKERAKLTPQQYEQIHHLLMAQVTRGGIPGMFGLTTPFYKADIPEDFIEQAREGHPDKTDDEITNEWWAGRGLEMWNKYHGKNPRFRPDRPQPSIPAQQVSLQVPVPTAPSKAAQPGPYGLTVPGSAQWSEFVDRALKAFREGRAETGEEAVREAP